MSGPQGGWLAHESMGYFQGSPADRADGFDSPLQETAVPDELQVSPWELAEAIAAYLAAPGSRLVAGADHSLSTLMRLGATQQLTGLKPPGDSILVPSLLKAATAAFAHSMLAPAAIRLLQHHRWPASAVPALQQWAYPSRSGFESGLALLEACLADAESASGQDSTDALAAASALALSLAKALRQGSAPAYQYSFTSVFQQIAKPLLLLHRVSTPAGRLALETAVDVVLDVSEGRPLSSRNQYGLSVGLLQSGCVAILRALSADVVAGCPALLKLACSCTASFQAALDTSAPKAPLNWSKVFTFPWAPAGDPRHQLQEFAFSPDRQQCVLPCTPRLDAIVEDYLNEDMREQAPKWRDLDAERVQLEGGADGWRFTKSHKAYQQEVAEHAEQRQKLDGLLQLLLPCLVLVLPCGGSSLSAGAAEDEAPPAKAPRLA